MERPRISIKLEPIDLIIEGIGILGLIALITLPFMYYNLLPETIPRHFGITGEVDAYSGKGLIWILPLIGILMYVGMFWLNKYPHIFNYPQEITKENAERQYKMATRMIRVLNAIITCVFAYITYTIIQTALGNQEGLGSLFTPVFLILVFGTLVYFLKN